MARFLYNYNIASLKLPYHPLYIYIEPTDHCNFRCVMCPHSMENRNSWKKGFMSLDLFEQIVAQFSEFKPLFGTSLYLGGESLLHRELEQMIVIGKKYGIHFGLSTNGSLLSKERIKSLVDAGLRGVRIDFSPDKETYEKACKGGDWEEVYNNILHLVEYRDKAQPKFRVIVKDLCLEKNMNATEREKSRDNLIKLFAGKRINKFETFEIHNWSGEFATHQVGSGFPLKKNNNNSPTQCSHLWFTLNIKYDGKVVPCCRDLRGDVVIGDFKNERLIDIWNNDNIVEMRRLHAQKQFDEIPLCRDCDRPWTGGKRGGTIPDMFKKYLKRTGILKR